MYFAIRLKNSLTKLFSSISFIQEVVLLILYLSGMRGILKYGYCKEYVLPRRTVVCILGHHQMLSETFVTDNDFQKLMAASTLPLESDNSHVVQTDGVHFDGLAVQPVNPVLW